jgi:hypothetical protein
MRLFQDYMCLSVFSTKEFGEREAKRGVQELQAGVRSFEESPPESMLFPAKSYTPEFWMLSSEFRPPVNSVVLLFCNS